MIDFGRDICADFANGERREWLVTNGIGGFASGTVAGVLTRRYHGLLFAALQPPTGRTLLVTKLDETADYNSSSYTLYSNRWVGGSAEPDSYHFIERFHLEGTTPVWSYALADALLEKRIWMQPGANTTYVQYRLRRATGPLSLQVKALVNYRDYHSETRAHDWQMNIEPAAHGLKVVAYEGALPFYLLCDRGEAEPQHHWYYRFFLIREANRGLQAVDDNLYAGCFRVTLQPGESFTFVASLDANPNLDGTAAYNERCAYEERLLAHAPVHLFQHREGDAIRQLVLAADQFVVNRPLPTGPNGRSILAGYPWFSDWGRDTMIALTGLTLVTGRAEVAATILRAFADLVSQGMLPNRFPDNNAQPEYDTVDATLWYFEAMRAYHLATGDDTLVRQLFPVLLDIIAWHQRGTRYNIQVDPADGLLYAGEPGQPLTWMDAQIGDWVVTPRTGKAVEINALWYNALCVMARFARLVESKKSKSQIPNPKSQIPSSKSKEFEAAAAKVKEGFARFWNDAAGCLYDVIDAPNGEDAAIRPNQLFAVALPHSPLEPAQQKAVVDVCGRTLLTSHGLRSLAPGSAGYVGSYGGNPQQRDSVYHQGTVWPWLIGPFVQAHYRVHQDAEVARSFLKPLLCHLSDHGLGSIGEICDGDPPHTPRGCIAQAWSVGQLLQTWAFLLPRR
jgi:predicted glycogen debranching enzyme